MSKTTLRPALFTLRPGALDHIMRTRRLESDAQLAAALGVNEESLARLRAGAKVTAKFALHIATLQGDTEYLGAYVDPVYGDSTAA